MIFWRTEMNKNRLTAVILAALLCCSIFAGCKDKTEDADSSGLPEGAVTTPVSSEELQELIDQGVIEDPNAAGDDTSEEVEPAPYNKGIVDNNVYRNEGSDLTLRIPSGWTVQDDYNLCTVMGVTYDFEDNDKNIEAISKLAEIYDLMASDSTQDKNVMVIMQDPAQLGMEGKSSAEHLDSMKSQLTSDNASFEFSDISEVSYSGNAYSMMRCIITPDEGTEVTQYYFVREANGRMITVMMSFPSADPINPDTIFA